MKSQPDKKRFEFVSEGPRGKIPKVVLFEHYGLNVYNLAFGDWDSLIDDIQFRSRSNNHDSDKVLATIAKIVVEFMDHYPDSTISVVGETAAKTRLYQMNIKKYIKEIKMLYTIQGWNGIKWVDFDTGKNYSAFTLKPL